MSNDLIRRSDAIETAYQLRHKPNDAEWGDWLKSFNAIPSADRPQGEWVEYETMDDRYDDIRCSCCQRLFTVDSYHFTDIGFIKDDFNYCPNCGARMEE